jgi:hypothetical protein
MVGQNMDQSGLDMQIKPAFCPPLVHEIGFSFVLLSGQACTYAVLHHM